jgi:hypothetical protein
LLKKLITHLSALRREGLLEAWTDRQIHAGGVIDDHIGAAMEEANLFLFLISASFIHSDYCFAKEFTRACQRQAKGDAIVVPLIVRECDWKIDALRRFKALPDDGMPVVSRHWHNEDEAWANIVGGLRTILPSKKLQKKSSAKKNPAKQKFESDERHVTDEQRAKLREIHEEVVNRMAVKAATLSDEGAKKLRGKWFGIIWSQFHEAFGTKEHGLQSLHRNQFEPALSWLKQYRASKDKNFKRANPQAYRNTLTKKIYTIVGVLGWSKDKLYSFAADKLGYAKPISSLDDLGNTQMETLKDRIVYENTKQKAKKAQSTAKRSVAKPTSGDD